MMTDEIDPPKICFPCPQYPVSVVAKTTDGFVSQLEGIVARHCPEYEPSTLRVTSSRQGSYQSFRFLIVAHSEAQLQALHEDLKSTGVVHMVL